MRSPDRLLILVSTVLIGLPALAKDAPTSRPSIEYADGAAVIAGFLESVARDADLPAEAKRFVLGLPPPTMADRQREFIPEALAVLYPRFKQALDAVAQEQTAQAVPVFEELARSSNSYLSVAATIAAGTGLVEMEDFERCDQLLAKTASAHTPIARYTLAADHYAFLRGYCRLQLLDYEGSAEALRGFLKEYPQAPERLRAAAEQILKELERRAPGRLGDVRDLLAMAGRRIRLHDTGDQVRERQREAVDLLNDLVEQAEEHEKSKSSSGGSKGSSGGSGSGEGQMPGGNTPGTGAKRSALPPGKSEIGALRRVRARPGEAWGQMPPKEREQVLQALQQQFPSRYRDLLEQYYQELAKDSTTP